MKETRAVSGKGSSADSIWPQSVFSNAPFMSCSVLPHRSSHLTLASQTEFKGWRWNREETLLSTFELWNKLKCVKIIQTHQDGDASPIPRRYCSPGCTGALGQSESDAWRLSMLHPSVLTGTPTTLQCSGQGGRRDYPRPGNAVAIAMAMGRALHGPSPRGSRSLGDLLISQHTCCGLYSAWAMLSPAPCL